MNAEEPTDLREDGRFEEIVCEYLTAVEQGLTPDPDLIMRDHPEFAERLRTFFCNDGQLKRATARMRGLDAANATPTLRRFHLAAPPLNVPREIAGYEILDVIAAGGMGVVYRARQAGVSRVVALKTILAGPNASQEDVERFRREAEASASLDHPNIVPIYEVGERDGIHFFSMKLVEGGTLAQSLTRYRGNRRAAVRLMVRVARAVHYAHERGILHRDLKPGNVLLAPPQGDEEPIPYVTDFGLAKRLTMGSSLTHTGMVVGTPSYMAPEQARGDRDLTPAADIFGLGCMLYHLLAGVRPFEADSPVATLLRVQNQAPIPLRRHDDNIERDLEIICERCLKKDPRARYASAADLADDLEAFLDGRPIQARSVGWSERVWRAVRRSPERVFNLILIAILLVLGIAIGTWTWFHEKLSIVQREDDPRESWRQYAATLYEIQAEEYRNHSAMLLCKAECRGWEWHHLGLVNRTRPLPLKVPAKILRGFCWTGTEGLAAPIEIGYARWRVPSRGPAEIREWKCRINKMAFVAPDLLLIADEDMQVSLVGSKEPAWTRKFNGARVKLLAASVDGQKWAVALLRDQSLHVEICAIEDGKTVRTLVVSPKVQELSFGPKGTLYAIEPKEIVVAEPGKKKTHGIKGNWRAWAVSKTEERIYLESPQAKVTAWEVGADGPRELMTLPSQARSLQSTGSGLLAVFAGEETIVSTWQIDPPLEKTREPLAKLQLSSEILANQDGRYLAAYSLSGAHLYVWELGIRPVIAVDAVEDMDVLPVAHGRSVVLDKNVLMVLETESNEVIFHPNITGKIRRAGFSRDGRWLNVQFEDGTWQALDGRGEP